MNDTPMPRSARPGPPRRPYNPPSIVCAETWEFETKLQCFSSKTVPCAPFGCISIIAS